MVSIRHLICILFVTAGWGAMVLAQALEVGAARRDITPPEGSSHYRGESSGAHDPLFARALVLRQGEETGALVICDLISIARDLSVKARSRIAEDTGIPYTNVSITGTHTHTGPRYHPRSPSDVPDEEYYAHLIEEIVGAAVDAYRNLQPAQLQSGKTKQEGLSFNRRYLMKDGKVRFNPGFQNPDIVRPMGPIDPEVGLLVFQSASSNDPLATLTVFAMHLDTVGGNEYSADYPMYLSESLRSQFGTDFISLFGTGTCGNINHFDVSGPRPQSGHDGITRKIGETLAATVRSALPNLPKVNQPSFRVLSRTIFVPMQDFTPEELAWAHDDSTPVRYRERDFLQYRRKLKIRSLANLREYEAIPPSFAGDHWTLPLEVHAFRLSNDTAVVTLPGEIFVELGLTIKEKSPFQNTLVIELANTNIAYVPNREAFAQGDYEVINSRVQPGGGEMLVETALQLLDQLK